MHSYHIFYFPFKWKIKGRESLLFAEQTNLDNIEWNPYSNWLKKPEITNEEEQQELYGEKNYYYEFVHAVLYDKYDKGERNSILKHFERKETRSGNVSYIISKQGGKTYTLKVDAINLNIYATGAGMLTFYLINEREDQKEPQDILNINQYGRRIFPPFYADIDGKSETAEYLAIEGLNGNPEWYQEDFSSYKKNLMEKVWEPARFIKYLIADLCDKMYVYPVIDDRMFVNCWYGNDELSKELGDDGKYDNFLTSFDNDFWFRYVFVDSDSASCRNKKMKKELIEKATYDRWQKELIKDKNRYYGALHGISRYSFVMLTDTGCFSKNILAMHSRTIYSRMVELVLIQRASTLRFSEEVTRVSQLSKDNKEEKPVVEHISSLYKEYIRFINQIHFEEVTAQDQGIELYRLMSETLRIDKYVESLDKELEELHNYMIMLEERKQSKRAELLNIIAMVFLPAALLTGIFNMNASNTSQIIFWKLTAIVLVLASIISYIMWYLIIKRKKKR